ncbi:MULTISPECIES: MotA/TolQ/ExbB proton channel family protein [Henriciella]|uniref:MotA/TolQ/ExbB proton channel family protein n=1 Tax=Henriciella TaxID=453849 RepID=UPI0035113840
MSLLNPIQTLIETGGPVLVLLTAVSILSLAVFLYKVWQFHVERIGKHGEIERILVVWDAGDRTKAQTQLESNPHWLADTLRLGMTMTEGTGRKDRLETLAEKALLPLEGGFRILDMIAQLTPLLGLFGTVLGMIEAFQALQGAGNQVDPSILAGGIWVALLTTAAGLAVAMPTSVALAWLESRIDAERAFAGHAISVVIAPVRAASDRDRLSRAS